MAESIKGATVFPQRRVVKKRVPTPEKSSQTDLKESDKTYSLHTDTDIGLQYVRLREKGLKEIASHYAKKYADKNLKIDVFATNHPTSEKDSLLVEERPKKDALIKKLKEIANTLENGKVRGLTYLINNKKGDVMHAMPFVVAKGADNAVRIIDFEGYFGTDQTISVIENSQIRGVKNYNQNNKGRSQNDHHSCTVFAIDTLKNCLIDDAFVRDVVGSSVHPVILNKMILGQNEDYISDLSEEKKEKYIRKKLSNRDDLEAGEEKEINLKAFYKGHHYAYLLNEDHINSLDKETQEAVSEIYQVRREIKGRDSDSQNKKDPTASAANAAIATKWLQKARENITKKQVFEALKEYRDEEKNVSEVEQVDQKDLKEILIKLPSSSPSKKDDGFEVKAFVNNRVLETSKGAWANTERQNNYRTLDGAYDSGREEEKSTMFMILVNIASDPRVKKLNKNQDLKIEEILKIVETAKNKGGITHEKDGADGYKKQENIGIEKISNALAKTVSGIYQKECEACGIYSGRKTSGVKSATVGSRMTFIPDEVEKMLSEVVVSKEINEHFKKEVSGKKSLVNKILKERNSKEDVEIMSQASL
jgi:hypothetical protein